jgi:L-iditol 2-dehydrogenase
MKAARLYAAYDLRIEEAPIPRPGPAEALLRVVAVGVCGSDLHYYREGGIGDEVVRGPLVMGHEFSAVVEELPEPAAGLKVGDLVAVEPGRNCGHCEFCERGDPNLCLNLRFCGSPGVDGALAEFLTYPARLLFPLPPALSAEEGVLLEPLGVAIHAVDLANFRVAPTVAVVGCGPIGLLIVQVARLAGARWIVASEPLAYRREFALRYGADLVLDPQAGDVTAAVDEATQGRGVDVAFEAAGEIDTPQQAVALARRGGHVILVGIPPEDKLSLVPSKARRKGLTLRFVRRMKHTYPRAIALAERGRLDLRSMITHRFPLEQIVEALELVDAYADGVIKAIVEP